MRGTLDIFRHSSGRLSDSCILGSGVKWCLCWASSALLLELHTSTSTCRIFVYKFELVNIFRQKIFWFEVIFRGVSSWWEQKVIGEANLRIIGGQGYRLLEKFGRLSLVSIMVEMLLVRREILVVWGIEIL